MKDAEVANATTLADALGGAALKVAVVKQLIAQYADFFMLVEEDGTPHIRTRRCENHGIERELYAHDSEESANRYAAPLMRLHVSERMNGGVLLETGTKLHATILVLNRLGTGLFIRLVRETLAGCDGPFTNG